MKICKIYRKHYIHFYFHELQDTLDLLKNNSTSLFKVDLLISNLTNQKNVTLKQILLGDAISSLSKLSNTQINNKKEEIPENIKQKIVNLLEYFSLPQVESILHISSKNIRLWAQQFSPETNSENFFVLNRKDPVGNEKTSDINMTFYLSNGHHLRFSDQLSTRLLKNLIHEFDA